MINRVVLVGRLTRDVEVRKTTSGLSVATFTVACDRRGSSSGNNNQQSADFISCVAWRQSADFLGSYARKGAMVGVEGRIQTRNYQNAQGQTVYVTEVVADNVTLLESKAQSESRAQNSYQNNGYNNNSYGNSGNYSNNNNYGNNGGYNNNSYSNNSYQNNYAQQNDPISSEDFNTGPSLDISSDDLPF